jgi:hypothetical protein
MLLCRVLPVAITLLALPTFAAAQSTPQPAAGAAPAAAATLSIPSPEAMLVMVRSALIALDQANKTGNYTVLHAIGGPQLQQSNPARLGEMFAALRQSGVDLQPVLVLTPQITQAPSITPQGLLLMVGYFPTQPLQIRFEVAYQPANGYWRLAGLNTSLVRVAAEGSPTPTPPAASVPPAQGPAAAAPAKTAPAQPKTK